MQNTTSTETISVSKRPNPLILLTATTLITLGIALRIAQYLHNRALWLDEAALAVNILDRNFSQLLEPMIYHQNSPYGFLFTVKALTLLLGTSEFALRAFPIIMAILSVPLFYLFTKRFSMTSAQPYWPTVLIALTFFVVGKHLIFYSNELRHYSTDIAIVCLLYILAHPLLDRPSDNPKWMRSLLLLFIAGLIINWFSLIAIVILASIGLVLYLNAILQKDYRALAILTLIGIGWILNFQLHVSIHNLNFTARNLQGDMLHNLAHAFAPFPPKSFADIKWFRETFELYFYLPGGLTYRGLGGFTFIAGCIALSLRNKQYAAILILPIVFVLIASALQRYPFWGRYVIFLMPIMLFMLAEGIAHFIKHAPARARAIPIVLFIVLAIQPFAHGLRIFVQSYDFGDDPRPLAQHIHDNWQQGDLVYLPFNQTPPFHYYLPRFGITPEQFEREPLFTEITAGNEAFRHSYRLQKIPELYIDHNRLWIPFRHNTQGLPPYPEHIGEIDEIGRQLAHIPGSGLTLYLYEAP